MDNFNLSKYLKNNPLLKQKGRVNESIGGFKPSKNIFGDYENDDFYKKAGVEGNPDQEFTYDGDGSELINYAKQELNLDIINMGPNKYAIKKVLDWDDVESLFDMYGIKDPVIKPSGDMFEMYDGENDPEWYRDDKADFIKMKPTDDELDTLESKDKYWDSRAYEEKVYALRQLRKNK